MKKLLFIFSLLLAGVVAFSQDGFDAKSLLSARTGKQRLVNDFASILIPSQVEALENKLVRFDDSTSIQITVVIIPTLGDYEIADYAVKLGRAWGIGNKGTNNGVLLLIAKEDRKLNISPGYGMEGALPDITCAHIIDEVIKPAFRGEDFYGGIDNGTTAIIKAARGEYKAPEGYEKRGKKKSGPPIILILVVIMIILSIFGGGGGRGGSFMSRRGYRGFISPFIFPGGGGGGGWSGGGGSSGGGGGFGGFGGGSFGGGGASGSW